MSVTSGEFFFTAFQLEPVLFAYIATVIQLDSAAKNASFRSHRLAGNNRVITFYNLVIERGKLFIVLPFKRLIGISLEYFSHALEKIVCITDAYAWY